MPSVSAPVLAAGIGAAGSIGGALLGSNAASQASQATLQATQLQVAELQREYNQTRSDHLPWLTTGSSALGQLAQIYGLDTYQNGKVVPGTPGKGPDYSNFYKSPDYNFRMQQGIAGVDAGAAARGSLDSGATRKAEIGYAGNLASGSFNDYANRLAGIAGVGQTAATQIGMAGENTANGISAAYQNQGNNLASSYLAQGQLWGNALSGLGGYASQIFNNSNQPSGSNNSSGSGIWELGW